VIENAERNVRALTLLVLENAVQPESIRKLTKADVKVIFAATISLPN
jgi:hypothetical protein